MIIKNLLIPMIVIMAGATPIAVRAIPVASGSAAIASGVALSANTSAAMAVESSNSFYAYSTESIMQMSVIQIGGEEYALPLTMKELAANGWKKPGLAKTRPGELYIVNRDDLKLSLSEDQQGVIERIVELYPFSGTLEIPADTGIRTKSSEEDPERAGIKIGISEEDLVGILNQLPLHWECAHLKNGTTRYKVIVPLGGPERAPFDEAEQTADRASAQTVDGASEQAYPTCEYVITVGDRQVKAVEIRMISDPGPDGWPDEILGFRAAAYYEKKAGEMPPLFRSEEQKDGRVLIRLFEELEDHIATWALYKSDRTGKGYDEAFDPNEKKVIDFMN